MLLPDTLIWLGLVLLGIAVGSYGTMIGVGGGFVLVPVLLFLYPNDPPDVVTSISLAVVFFNALSGTLAYVRQGRVDYLAANSFALATIPGAVLGALTTSLIPRRAFAAGFALLLFGVSTLIMFRPTPRAATRLTRRGEVTRQITDASGDTFVYSYDLRLGVLLSLVVGFLASLLGVGGGIIHVPMMVLGLHFPAHLATATSQYVLVITSLTGTVAHLLSGQHATGYERTLALAIGVLIGAQLGAKLSTRLQGATLVRLLGLALAAVAVRLVVTAIRG